MNELPSENLVPGDIVFPEAGEMVPSDLRLTEASRLQADESSLTGESVTVGKEVSQLETDTPLAEQRNMAFKGTAVTMGSGQGVVVATGMETELGKVASLTEEAQEELTPLERRLNRLAYRLVWITLGIGLFIDGHKRSGRSQGSPHHHRDSHRSGRGSHTGGFAHCGHHCPGQGDVADGSPQCLDESTFSSGDAGGHKHHLHR